MSEPASPAGTQASSGPGSGSGSGAEPPAEPSGPTPAPRGQATLAVASLAFRECARNRVLHALVLALVLITGLSHLAAWVSGDDPPRRLAVVAHLSLSGVSLLATLASIFLGTHLVYQEVERRTIYTILARPLGRGSFVLGKFLGLFGIMGLAVLAMGAAALISYAVAAWVSGAALGGLPWGKLILALAYTYLELSIVIGIALFFSVAAHPIEGAVFSFVVALAGHMTRSLKDLGAELVRQAERSAQLAAAEAGSQAAAEAGPGVLTRALVGLLDLLYVLLPDLEHFNLRAQAVYDLDFSTTQLLVAPFYAAVYTAILLALASLAFRRRIL